MSYNKIDNIDKNLNGIDKASRSFRHLANEFIKIKKQFNQQIVIDNPIKRPKGRELSEIAKMYGTKRWLWIIEPDWSLRLRLIKIINPKINGRGM